MRIFIMILVGFSILWGENYWDNFRNNYRQDGLSPLKGPTKPVFLGEIRIRPLALNKSSEKNIYSEKSSMYAWPSSAGVISEDSTLYAHTTSQCNYLIAVKNAQLLWREEFSGEYEQQEMCIDEKGLLYFETGNGLICFDPKERIILWERGLNTPCHSIIFIPGGSNIYVMTGSSYSDGILYAINKDNGARTWSYNLGENNYRTMAIGTDNGYYYAKYNNDKLTVFYPPNAFRYGCSPYPTPPSIDKNGVIYSVASDTLYAYNPGLYQKWKTALNDTTWFQSPCALSPDGGIIACSPRGYVHKVSRDGNKLWTSEYLCHELTLPTVDSDGRIYIYAQGNYNSYKRRGLYCLNKDGTICFTIAGSLSSQVLIAPGRIIYSFGEEDIYCYGQDPNGFEDREDKAAKIPEKEIRVYPNPFNDRLNIESPSSGAVYDITGRKVYSFNKGLNKADTSIWCNGIYLIKYGKKVIKVVKVK